MSDHPQQQLGQFSTVGFNSSAIAPPVLQTFTPFDRLLPELRAMIWNLTFPRGEGPTGRRRITLRFVQVDLDHGEELEWTGGEVAYLITSCRFSGVPEPPIALWVCQESRREALKNYRLLFDFSGRPDMPDTTPIYYNPKLDIIAFPAINMPGLPQDLLGFAWLQRQAPAELDAIESLEVRGNFLIRQLNKDGDDGVNDGKVHIYDPFPFLQDDRRNEDSTSLLYYFRRLRFLNLIDIAWPAQPERHLLLWDSPERPGADSVRAFIGRRQATDPTWWMPNIRFAPPGLQYPRSASAMARRQTDR